MAETVRRRVRVHGRVQGVFFRDTCRRRAIAEGVVGSVRNTDDGDVEAVFEGAAAAVDALVTWCRQGPAQARVDRVDTFDEEPCGGSGFSVVA